MKNPLLLLAIAGLSLDLAMAQTGRPSDAPFERPLTRADLEKYLAATNSLSRFDLEFRGGTPQELVKAIEKVTGKPLNTVIPDEYANLKIPAVSVKNMNVAQLFEVLIPASKKAERFIVLDPRDPTRGGHHSDIYRYDSTYGFKTEGVPADTSIWYFYWDRGYERAPWQVLSSTVCRFYQLRPCLDAGYQVEDITAAVETGWKMLGVTKLPEMQYHKDTKVLIAVGEEEKVNMIGDVLNQLRIEKSKETPAGKRKEP